MKHSTKHPLWDNFKIFCDQNGILLYSSDNWEVWWDCYLEGAKAFRTYVNTKLEEVLK